MANDFLNPSVFANKAITLLENDMVLGNKVHADYSKDFTAVGDTINVRKPTAYQGQDDNLDVSSYSEDILQGKTTLQMNKTVTIKIDVGAIDRTLSFDRVSEDVIEPAVLKMKDRIEVELANLYSSLHMYSGTPGTVPATFKSLGTPGAIMTDAGVPRNGRFAMHGTDASLELADGLKDVFVQGMAKTALQESTIGRYGGFDNYESVHAPTHTVGDYAGTPLIKGAGQAVTYAASKDSDTQTLVTDGWSNSKVGLLNVGDVFTIANVYAVNPVSKQSTARLATFTVRAKADSSGAGEATLVISPPMVATGAYQNVTAVPADNAAITVKTGTANASYKQSLLLHPKAFALVTRPLKIESGAGLKTSTKTGNRVTISCSEWTDPNTLKHNMRFDMLFGVKCLDPRLGARLTN